MKKTTSILTLLALVTAAQAEDMNKGPAGAKNEATEQTTTTAPAPRVNQGTVARSAVTDAIENREPVGKLADVTTVTEKLYYFTELRDMEGETVTHRWEFNGQTMAEVAFPVRGQRWRIYSSKNLSPDWTGEWRVSVVDVAGKTLHTDTFMYTQAPAASAASGEMPKDNSMTGAADIKADASAKQ